MTQLELAKKAIETIGWHSFHCRIYAREVGKRNYLCSHYDDEIELSSEQICFLLKEQLDNEELFEGIKTEEVDVDEIIVARAEDGDWPDIGLRAMVNNTIPSELTELICPIIK